MRNFAIFIMILGCTSFGWTQEECPTDLVSAVLEGQYDRTQNLLNETDFDINVSLDHCDLRPYQVASSSGLEFWDEDYPEGSTILHVIAREANTLMYRLFTSRGANENLRDSTGKSPKEIIGRYAHLPLGY